MFPVPRLPSNGVYISQLVRFARCCTRISDFHSKSLQITSKLLTQGYRCHRLRKTFGKFFRSYSDLLSKFCEKSFQEYVSEGYLSPDPQRCSSLQTKVGEMRSEFCLVGL